MKRFIAVLMAVLLVCTAFAGCFAEGNGGVTTSAPSSSEAAPGATAQTPGATEQTPGATTEAPEGSEEPEDTSIPVVTLPDISDEPAPDFEGHTDADNDKTCDDCGIPVVTTVDFYAVNDLHGKFVNSGATVGVEGLTTYLKTSASADDNPIFLSSGDMWQGGSQSNLTKGRIVTDWMNALGFVAMTLGNHEFDWGEDYVIANAGLADFPLLAINIYDKTTNKQVDYCESSVIVECRGLQVGIIGAIGDCYSSISGEHVGNIYFKTGRELTELVKAESDRLRDAGADIVIYSIHDGYGSSSYGSISDSSLSSYYDVVLSGGYVDMVFEGHTHMDYVLRDSKNVYHLQNSGDNGGISHAEIEYNFANGEYTVTVAEHVDSYNYSSLAEDAIVAQLLAKYDAEISKAEEIIGENDVERDGDDLLSLVAQLYFEVGNERWGDKYDIVLGGGFMSVRSPYYLHSGTVTYADLQTILPFDNQLVLCSIKGRELVSKFLQTTNSRYYIYCGEYGNSIKNNVDYNATYYVITDTYSSTYTSNKLTEIERYDADVYARDLLADYIRAGNFTSGVKEHLTVARALAIGAALPENGETAQVYRVSGQVVEVYNTTYGNLIIKDEYGNTLNVYGTWGADGTRYDKMSDPPKVGDTITVEAVIKRYVNKSTGEDFAEMFQSVLIEKK